MRPPEGTDMDFSELGEQVTFDAVAEVLEGQWRDWRETSGRLAALRREAVAERDRLADKLRQVRELCDPRRNPAYIDRARILAALDASPGAGTGQRDEYSASAITRHRASATYREAANFAGLLMLHSCGRGMAAFDRPPPPGGTCPTCEVAGQWRQLYLRDEPSAGSETGDGDG